MGLGELPSKPRLGDYAYLQQKGLSDREYDRALILWNKRKIGNPEGARQEEADWHRARESEQETRDVEDRRGRARLDKLLSDIVSDEKVAEDYLGYSFQNNDIMHNPSATMADLMKAVDERLLEFRAEIREREDKIQKLENSSATEEADDGAELSHDQWLAHREAALAQARGRADEAGKQQDEKSYFQNESRNVQSFKDLLDSYATDWSHLTVTDFREKLSGHLGAMRERAAERRAAAAAAKEKNQ